MLQYILIISLTITLVSTAETGKRLIKLDLSEPAIWMTDDEMKQAFTDRKTHGFVDFTREGVEVLQKPIRNNGYKYPNHPRYQSGASSAQLALGKGSN